MDETSRKILRLLQSEPDLTVAEIGERVGLSHTPCWRRIKEMERLGIIRGRIVAIDPKLVGFEVSVFCFVRLKQHDEETLLERYGYTNINLDTQLAAMDFDVANGEYGLRRR